MVATRAQGAQSAFAEIVRRYSNLLYSAAWRILGEQVKCEDVVQGVLLKLWERPRWDASRGVLLSTWLYRVTLNAAIDHRRRRARETELPENVEVVDGGLVQRDFSEEESNQEEKMLSALVRKLLGRLPKRQEKALVLCYFENMSHKQAAAIIGVSAKAVESLVARGRAKLLGYLRQSGIEVEDLQ